MKKWFCTGFDDGDSWVQFGLDELGSCGPYGEKVLAEFEKQQQKRKIRFDFKESESSKMLVRPIRGGTKITIQGGSWKKRNAQRKQQFPSSPTKLSILGSPRSQPYPFWGSWKPMNSNTRFIKSWAISPPKI